MSENFNPYSRSTNGYAIAGFILSIICCAPLGIIFSAIGLSQVNTNQNQDGKGLAIAGLIIGVSSIALGLLLFLLSSLTPFWNEFWDEFWVAFEEEIYGNTYQI